MVKAFEKEIGGRPYWPYQFFGKSPFPV